MVRFTWRIDDYTYNKVKLMAKFYNKSIKDMLIELVQIGYLVKENENEKNKLIKLDSK